MRYQQQMGVAMAGQQNRANLLSSLGSFGSFAAQNPALFNFGSSPSLGMNTNVGGNMLGFNSNGSSFNVQDLNSFGGTTGATGYNIGRTTLGANQSFSGGISSNWNPTF